jgi:hypothetical protein
MTTTAALSWHEANQHHLAVALARLREVLQRHAAREEAPPGQPASAPQCGAATSQVTPWEADGVAPRSALEVVCSAFALSPFERDILLLCAGIELDASFALLCAAAQGDPRRPYPTFSLALAALPEAHWSALTPVAPLRHWRLIELGSGDTVTTSLLRIDERVLHYLTGVAYLDERLRPLLEPLRAAEELPPSHHAIARRIADLWSLAEHAGAWPAVLLCGPAQAGKRAIAAAAGAALGLQVYTLHAADLPHTAAERQALAHLWERETLLSGSALLLDCEALDSPDILRTAIAFLESVRGMVLVTSREPFHASQRPCLCLDICKPSAAEQKTLWQSALGRHAASLNGQVEAVVTQFNLDVRGIHAASAQVFQHLSTGSEDGSAPLLWDACRVQARPRLDDLAQRIESAAVWDDLVLPEVQRQILRDIATHVRQRATVYETWGFAAKGTRGLGISALFAGPSGTGKTMAAEVLAHALRLDLYHIDLSAVVSKYIGETERNLRRVFDAAEEGGAILLFDEADALFGKRSEVKDSHDRYANLEVSYLLQRMEAYRGLAILTTNMKTALDQAFLRRLRFVVQFPFPDVAQRAEIWRGIFPVHTPTEDLEIQKLARLNIAGGNIRNIALHAAFLAADAGVPVRMAHLVLAARSEYAKLEKPLTEAEVAGWV